VQVFCCVHAVLRLRLALGLTFGVGFEVGFEVGFGVGFGVGFQLLQSNQLGADTSSMCLGWKCMDGVSTSPLCQPQS